MALAGCDSEAEWSSGAPLSSPDITASATASRAPLTPSPRDAAPSAISSPAADKTQKPKATQKSKATQSTKVPGRGGTKYTKCADGDCKVSFSGSVTFPLSGWTVSATMKDGGVQVRLTNPDGLGGGGGFLAGPGCTVAVHADGGGRLGCDQPGTPPEPGGYAVHLLKLDGGTAVIRATLG